MTKRQKWLVAAGLAFTALAGTVTGQIVGIQQVPALDYNGYPTTSVNNPSTGKGRVFYSTTDSQMHCLNNDGSSCFAAAGGSGTVTSVSFTGGLISVATPTTTPAFTVAGTSGGIPFFDSASTWNTTAQFTANGILLGGGAGTAPKTVAGIVTNGANSLSLGGVGLGSGLINLLGTTSGTATIQGPAVAGTAGNAIAFSNAISTGGSVTATGGILAGAAQSIGFSGRTLLSTGADGILTVSNNAITGLTKLTLGPATSSFPALCPSGTTVLVGLANGTCTTLAPVSASAITGNTFNTGTNCANGASPAVCVAAASGAVAVPTGTNPTLTINTTAVTANSRIFVSIDESLTIAATTCNTTLSTLIQPVVTARTAGTSFTIQIGAVIATNPACVSYLVMN